MSHPSQKEFVKNCLSRFSKTVSSSNRILEVGSQNINGSIRDYFPNQNKKNWVGLDIGKGLDVDFTIPGELIQLPNGWADISFSTECFEHAKSWKDIMLNIVRITRKNGLIILTFAGKGRAAHGTIDTEPESSPFTQNYYKNLSISDFMNAFNLDKYFSRYSLEVNSNEGDTYFWGIRNENLKDTEWMSSEECLARARGQLAVIAETNRELKREIFISKTPLLAIYKGLKKISKILSNKIFKN